MPDPSTVACRRIENNNKAPTWKVKVKKSKMAENVTKKKLKVFNYLCQVCGNGYQTKTQFAAHKVSHGPLENSGIPDDEINYKKVYVKKTDRRTRQQAKASEKKNPEAVENPETGLRRSTRTRKTVIDTVTTSTSTMANTGARAKVKDYMAKKKAAKEVINLDSTDEEDEEDAGSVSDEVVRRVMSGRSDEFKKQYKYVLSGIMSNTNTPEKRNVRRTLFKELGIKDDEEVELFPLQQEQFDQNAPIKTVENMINALEFGGLNKNLNLKRHLDGLKRGNPSVGHLLTSLPDLKSEDVHARMRSLWKAKVVKEESKMESGRSYDQFVMAIISNLFHLLKEERTESARLRANRIKTSHEANEAIRFRREAERDCKNFVAEAAVALMDVNELNVILSQRVSIYEKSEKKMKDQIMNLRRECQETLDDWRRQEEKSGFESTSSEKSGRGMKREVDENDDQAESWSDKERVEESLVVDLPDDVEPSGDVSDDADEIQLEIQARNVPVEFRVETSGDNKESECEDGSPFQQYPPLSSEEE